MIYEHKEKFLLMMGENMSFFNVYGYVKNYYYKRREVAYHGVMGSRNKIGACRLADCFFENQ